MGDRKQRHGQELWRCRGLMGQREQAPLTGPHPSAQQVQAVENMQAASVAQLQGIFNPILPESGSYIARLCDGKKEYCQAGGKHACLEVLPDSGAEGDVTLRHACCQVHIVITPSKPQCWMSK